MVTGKDTEYAGVNPEDWNFAQMLRRCKQYDQSKVDVKEWQYITDAQRRQDGD